jgi:hypothetical protein
MYASTRTLAAYQRASRMSIPETRVRFRGHFRAGSPLQAVFMRAGAASSLLVAIQHYQLHEHNDTLGPQIVNLPWPRWRR